MVTHGHWPVGILNLKKTPRCFHVRLVQGRVSLDLLDWIEDEPPFESEDEPASEAPRKKARCLTTDLGHIDTPGDWSVFEEEPQL